MAELLEALSEFEVSGVAYFELELQPAFRSELANSIHCQQRSEISDR